MRYGMPYMGSKNQIAKWVVENLPKCKNLYDVFGGGGAITHYACLCGKFENVIYNEFNSLIFEGFKKAIRGGYKGEKRWISREDFYRLKDRDPYVAICFSFGNDLNSYCYSKEIEPCKKALHYAICYQDFSLLDNLGIKIDHNLTGRLEIIKKIKQLLNLKRFQMQNLEALERLQGLERLERLQGLKQLESLERLERLQGLNLDYRQIKFNPDSVLYCDPPYENTHKYKIKFDYEAFYNWCEQQDHLTIISSYEMPEKRFICVAVKEKRSLMCKNDNSTLKKECLFIPKHQKELFEKMRG